MINERHEEHAALHALGLLEGAERDAFGADLAADADLAALTGALAVAAADLALAAPQLDAPIGLKEKILAGLPAQTTAKVVGFPLGRFAPWVAAAAAAAVAAGLVFQNHALRQEGESLRTERQLAEAACRIAQNQLSERSLLAEGMINRLNAQLRRSEDLARLKVTALAALAGNTKEAQAIAVWDPGRETGLLTVEKLPAIADNQDYQIWVVDPAYPIPVDGGVFKPGADGRAVLTFRGNKPIKTVAAFAISLEKRGGVPKAEGPIVLLGKLSQ